MDLSLSALGLGLILLLLFVHALREVVHTSGRLYLQQLLEGEEAAKSEWPPAAMDVRTVLTLRLLRVLALTSWAVFMFASLASYSWPARGAITLVLAVLTDEASRLVGQWISLRLPRSRAVLWRVSRLVTRALMPVTALILLVSRHLFGLEPARDVMLALDEDQILIVAHPEVLQEPARAAERELITNIFDFRETIVREIMVPRLDIVAVPATASLREALDIIVTHGHSRVPVYKGTIDNIVGVLYAKDLLRVLRDAYPAWPEKPVTAVMRPPYFVPDSKRVSELLPEMQQKKVHLAIVVDEYGGTAGVVTIEDILEEIVGEIQDEFDREMPEMVQVGEREYIINARADLEDVSDFIGVELPDEYADTLGGFIYTLLNRMPVRGDVVVYPPVRMQVLSVEGRRIRAVRVTVDPTLERRTKAAEEKEKEVASGQEPSA